MNRYHIHRCYELYYLFSGERGFFLKDRTYSIRAGDLVLIDSNELHKSLDTGAPGHDRVVLYYEMPFFDRYDPAEASLLLAPFRESQVLRLNMKEQYQLEALFRSFFNELHEASPGYQVQLRHLAAELLLRSFRIASKRTSVLAEETTPIKQKIKEIVHFINSHYSDPTLRMEAISRKFYISPSYVSRNFKEATGYSITEYINLVRIKEAQSLLSETDWSITEISECVGFDNFSHFGKMFKKIANASPRIYRRQCLEKA
ncbi:helix-turn-helix domain-containing protein [Paenibacillus sp. S-38]|uniref:helix-turn-helix domain-containing protein n=1 Tax=Paenibacillus sp. S-38 TaxID=3416710 RepID=UPI003CE72AC3